MPNVHDRDNQLIMEDYNPDETLVRIATCVRLCDTRNSSSSSTSRDTTSKNRRLKLVFSNSFEDLFADFESNLINTN